VNFCGGRNIGEPGEKSSEQERERERERAINKLNPLIEPGPGFEPGPHWWEVNVLTTAPPLLP